VTEVHHHQSHQHHHHTAAAAGAGQPVEVSGGAGAGAGAGPAPESETEKLCAVCLNNPRTHALPCGHHAYCGDCVERLESCSLCRKPTSQKRECIIASNLVP